MKKWLAGLPMSKIMFTANVAAGIAWAIYAISLGLGVFIPTVVRTIIFVIAVCLEAFGIFALWPKDKWDEMAEKNYTKAQSETLGHIKTYVMLSLIALAIEFAVEYKFLFKIDTFMKMLGTTILIILVGEFAFVDLVRGLYFRKFENEPDDEIEDE